MSAEVFICLEDLEALLAEHRSLQHENAELKARLAEAPSSPPPKIGTSV